MPSRSNPREISEVVYPPRQPHSENEAAKLTCTAFTELVFDRVHSFGTCPVSYSLLGGEVALLLVCGQQRSFTMSFKDSSQDRLDFGMPRRCVPCDFDGDLLVWMQTKFSEKRIVSVWNWSQNAADIECVCNVAFPSTRGAVPWGFKLLRDGKEIGIDSAFLVGITEYSHINIYSVETGCLLRKWKAHNARILSIATTMDRRTFTTSARDGTIGTWNIDGERMHYLDFLNNTMTHRLEVPYFAVATRVGDTWLRVQ